MRLNFMNTNSLLYNMFDGDLEGRETFSLSEYGLNEKDYIYNKDKLITDLKIGIDNEENEEFDLCPVSPMYIFVGSTDTDLLYAKLDRYVVQRGDGKISRVFIDNGDGIATIHYGNYFETVKGVKYIKAENIFDELDYVQKSLTDDVVTLGENNTNVYDFGVTNFGHMDGYAKLYYPAGEDEKYFYMYVIYVGNVLAVREDKSEPLYGVILLTTSEGAPILARNEK